MPKQLKEHSDFERMRVFSQRINVYQDGHLLDSNVTIDNHDLDYVVSKDGTRYVKENCQFFSIR